MGGKGHLAGRSYPHSRLVEVRIPEALLAEMLQRATAQAVENGGRFQVEDDSILIWPAETPTDDHEMGSVEFRHNAPEVGWALLYRLHWNPAHGGSEDGIRQAVNELIGSELI